MFAGNPVDVDDLLARQRDQFDEAWCRYTARYPREVRSMEIRLRKAADAARIREAVRSEFTRIAILARPCALRAGEFIGVDHDVFFLTHNEIWDLLQNSGRDALQHINLRKMAYTRYQSLPPYPAVIRGHFDAVQWANDPNRRSDFFDSHNLTVTTNSRTRDNCIKGLPGSAGQIVGYVRRLDHPDEGDRLQPGEILVTAQTNISWTPIFPRASAIVTDVGAPLSHAAIVARELGIPAVVGCRDATMRLHTGQRVKVNGGQGIVEILD